MGFFSSNPKQASAGMNRRNNARRLALAGADAITHAFNELPFKVQKKVLAPAIRKATRTYVLPKAKANCPRDTGALSKSLTVKAAKTSKAMSRRGITRVGSIVTVDKKRLVKHMQAAGASDARIQAATEKYFYPIGLELGNIVTDARRAMTRGLHDSTGEVMAYVKREVATFINYEASVLRAATRLGLEGE